MRRKGQRAAIVTAALAVAACARDNPEFDEAHDGGGTAVTSGSATTAADGGPNPTAASQSATDSSAMTGQSDPTDPSADSGPDPTVDTGADMTMGGDATAGDTGIDQCPPGSGTIIQLLATADTFLVDEVACGECADTNYGGAEAHPVGSSKAYGDSVMLLRFDDAQPGPIGSAVLELAVGVVGVVPGNALVYVDIFADSCGWQEGTGPAALPSRFDGTATFNSCDHPLVPWAGGSYEQETSLTLATGPAPMNNAVMELVLVLDADGVEQWLLSSSRTLLVSMAPVETAAIEVLSRESANPPVLELEYCR